MPTSFQRSYATAYAHPAPLRCHFPCPPWAEAGLARVNPAESDGAKGTKQELVWRRGDCVGICHFQTVGSASALGKRTSRSEAVRLVPLRLSTSGSVSYDAAYTHPAPVRLPLSSSQSTYEEVTSSYHNMPGSYQDNGYEDSQISALLPIYYQ